MNSIKLQGRAKLSIRTYWRYVVVVWLMLLTPSRQVMSAEAIKPITNSVSNARGVQIVYSEDMPLKEFAAKTIKATTAAAKVAPAGEQAIIHQLEFKDANMLDVVRALADISGLNIVATSEATKKPITIYLQNITVKDALDTITKNSGLWYRQDVLSKTYRIMSTTEYQRDMVVYREDTTRVFNLLHPNPVIVATAIRDIFPTRVQLSLGVTDTGTDSTLRQATTRTTTPILQTTTTLTTGAARTEQISDQKVITDKMTPDQLEKLDAAAEKSGTGRVSSEDLSKINGSVQPIYITINREHNLIVVRTSDNEAMKEIERLIKEMDRPTPQVLLEMKILALDVGDSFRQSFHIDYAGGRSILGVGGTTDEGGTFVYQFMNDNIRARLELLATNNKVSTLSSPLLLASNNKPAKVFVGVEQVITTGFQATGGAVTGTTVIPSSIVPTTEVRNIGNTLQILPKINADKTVTLLIQQDSSSVVPGGSSIPIPVGNLIQYFNVDTVKTSNIEGTVVAKDGLTVAIGGLIDSSNNKSVQKVPVLGDIPVMGNLFKRNVESNTKRELILLITPHIITTPPEGENVTRDAIEQVSEQQWNKKIPAYK
jgi:type II secretory pathway component GspD/PulD (secretin)